MNQYKYDIHIHTSETSNCGKVPGKELVRIYRKAGYQGIVITDHYYEGFFEMQDSSWDKKVEYFLEGYYNALDEGIKLGLHVLPGMEITFAENYNDYLVYGIDEHFLKENKELYKLGLEGFRKLTCGTEIILVQAHPFRPLMIQAPPCLLDGIEVYNGNVRHDARNHLAKQYALENGLIMLSGSDFHQKVDAARGGIIFNEEVRTPKELVNAIKKGKITALIES